MRKTLLTTFLALSFSHYASAADVYIHDTFSSNSLSHWETFNQISDKVDIAEDNSSLRITTKNPQKTFGFAGVSKTFEPKRNISLSVVLQGDFSNYVNINPRGYIQISNKDESEGAFIFIGRDGNHNWRTAICTKNGGCLTPPGTYSNMSKIRISVMKFEDEMKIFANGELIHSGVTALQSVEKIILGAGGANIAHSFPVYFSEFSLHTGI